MKKAKINLYKIAIATLSAIFVLSSMALALEVTTYTMPMTGTVPAFVSLSPIYINGSAWTNGTLIDWGALRSGSNLLSLDAYNSGNVNLTVTFTSTPPENWTLTYSQNGNPVAPTEWLNGTLALTVPQNATLGAHSWTGYLQVTAS